MMNNHFSYVMLGAMLAMSLGAQATTEKKLSLHEANTQWWHGKSLPANKAFANILEVQKKPISIEANARVKSISQVEPITKVEPITAQEKAPVLNTSKESVLENKEAENTHTLFRVLDRKALVNASSQSDADTLRNVAERLKARKNKSTARQPVKRAKSYTVRGKRYRTLARSDGFVQTGKASWYGRRFHGRKTASGERFDMNALTAAHKELPLGTKIEVVNNDNGRRVVVTVNDRGPFHGNRVLDLSKAAAQQIGAIKRGTANVTIRAL